MAYTGNSIVDFLRSQGQDYSFGNRTNLAKQYGITNYSGSADQNLALLAALRGGQAVQAPASPQLPPTLVQSSSENALPQFNYRDYFANAAGSGLSIEDAIKNAPVSGVDKDLIARNYGFPDYVVAQNSLFQDRAKSDQQIYKELYDAAGAQDLLNKARLVREQRISALEKNTGSPFLSQASLTGMNNAVEAQASARERSYLDEYAAVLDQVNKTASLAIGDAQRQDALKQERIMAIQKAVESEVEKRRNDLRSLYLQDYLSGKKPETITIGDSLLSYNPKTKQFEVAYTKEKAKSYEIKTLDDGSNVIFDPQTGEYEPIGSGGTVINPNGSLEIVNGYNITKYATKGTLADPNYRPGDTLHGADVAKTYSSLPLDMEGLQTYIKAKFPKSPISAQMIFDSSAKYGVDPGMVAAMMINDSSLGTAGLGAKTRNPGNVGNDDAGNTRTYSSWKDGVDAVSKWLANNKVSSQDQGVIDSSAQAFVGAKLTKDKRAAFNQGVNALKQQGKAQEAAQFIRQTAVDNLDGARKKDYDSISDVASQAKSIGSTLKNGPVLNIYQTALQSSKSLAAVSKDPEWTKLVAEVGNSMAQYRNKLFGAALTDTELAIANSFLFDINRDTAKDLEIKIKALDTFANTVKSRIESEAMGTVYDSSAKLNNINSILSQPGSGTASSTSRLPINSLLKGIGGSISSWFTR